MVSSGSLVAISFVPDGSENTQTPVDGISIVIS